MTDKPTLMLYNSLTRKKEAFTPQDPKRVTMYNCGPTVYSYAHIGNARAAVVADVLFRVLRYIYGKNHVIYARNITDVDDKIIASAKELGVPISEITEKYAEIYNEDLTAIGCLEPTHQPKATDHIGGMIDMISDLIEKGFAYVSDGHVFFDVSKYEDYGKLSGNTLDALRGGDRVGEGEVARKKNAADFVLWKPELDGVGWDAPFGLDKENLRGRPGWHIECSAMAKATLCDTAKDYGNIIDIHCGGVDLKFPHHENEKAQSCCANGTEKFAHYWVHNEFLNMGTDKMSKSLGNVKLIRDLLKDWDGEVIRLALLKAHYRSELVWSEDLLRESKAQLDGWYRIKTERVNLDLNQWSKKLISTYEALKDGGSPAALEGVYSDLNIPEILSSLSIDKKLVHMFRQNSIHSEITFDDGELDTLGHRNFLDNVVFVTNFLGLLQKDPVDWFRGNTSSDEETEIIALITERDDAKTLAMAAKKAGDKALMGAHFKRSDEIRDSLKARGIILEDKPDGTTGWRKV